MTKSGTMRREKVCSDNDRFRECFAECRARRGYSHAEVYFTGIILHSSRAREILMNLFTCTSRMEPGADITVNFAPALLEFFVNPHGPYRRWPLLSSLFI